MSGPFGSAEAIKYRVSKRLVLQPGARADAHDGCCAWQAQFDGKAALALDPASSRETVTVRCLMRPWHPVEINEAVEAIGGSVDEIALDLGSARRLVGLHGEQVVGAGGSNGGISGDGVDRDERALEAVICRQALDKHRDRKFACSVLRHIRVTSKHEL